MKDNCPIFSYSIVKVIEGASKESVPLVDVLNLFKVDSEGLFSVLESYKSYKNFLAQMLLSIYQTV